MSLIADSAQTFGRAECENCGHTLDASYALLATVPIVRPPSEAWRACLRFPDVKRDRSDVPLLVQEEVNGEPRETTVDG